MKRALKSGTMSIKMMHPAAPIKAGVVHIRAFTTGNSEIRIATHTGVVARLDRAIQYAAAVAIEP
jgi:hypothetical protein